MTLSPKWPVPTHHAMKNMKTLSFTSRLLVDAYPENVPQTPTQVPTIYQNLLAIPRDTEGCSGFVGSASKQKSAIHSALRHGVVSLASRLSGARLLTPRHKELWRARRLWHCLRPRTSIFGSCLNRLRSLAFLRRLEETRRG